MKTTIAKQTVLSQIIIRQPQRKTANVGLWRAAMKSACVPEYILVCAEHIRQCVYNG